MNEDTIMLLKLFGEYDHAMEKIAEDIKNDYSNGMFGIQVYKEDYHEITDEMEEYFDGQDVFEITVDWNLCIE